MEDDTYYSSGESDDDLDDDDYDDEQDNDNNTREPFVVVDRVSQEDEWFCRTVCHTIRIRLAAHE